MKLISANGFVQLKFIVWQYSANKSQNWEMKQRIVLLAIVVNCTWFQMKIYWCLPPLQKKKKRHQISFLSRYIQPSMDLANRSFIHVAINHKLGRYPSTGRKIGEAENSQIHWNTPMTIIFFRLIAIKTPRGVIDGIDKKR